MEQHYQRQEENTCPMSRKHAKGPKLNIGNSDMTIQSNRLLKILVIYFDATPRQQTLQTDINSFTHRTLLTVGDNKNYVNFLLVMGLINLKVAHLYKNDFRKKARRQTNK